MRPLLTVDELASYIHKSVASIRSDATRNPASLPPICRLPGTKRLLWRIEDVERWIAQHIHGDPAHHIGPSPNHDAKSKRGRPTKAEQVARQRQHASANVPASTGA
ncbi:MAG: hypothetical protein B7Z35_02050 [Hydrogenophilales bacterium 12-61-10]|nr:MAG: hypothetical protein B7Z35_02050 [Hydrogenophilales bacterium 12-61-10]OYX28269.1 MAG: hypothetical protein B7Z03_12005 [Hydrogenophilales bacterium 32-62-9]